MRVEVCLMTMVYFGLGTPQQYTEFEFETNGEPEKLDQFGISPDEDQLIFELKSCVNSFVKYKTDSDEQLYIVRIGDSKIDIWMEGQSKHEKYIQHGNCDSSFRKFKIIRKSGNLKLWLYETTGWRLLLNYTSPTTPQSEPSHMTVSSQEAFWRLYKTDHNTFTTFEGVVFYFIFNYVIDILGYVYGDNFYHKLNRKSSIDVSNLFHTSIQRYLSEALVSSSRSVTLQINDATDIQQIAKYVPLQLIVERYHFNASFGSAPYFYIQGKKY